MWASNILVEMSCDRIRFVNISISEHLSYFSVQKNFQIVDV